MQRQRSAQSQYVYETERQDGADEPYERQRRREREAREQAEAIEAQRLAAEREQEARKRAEQEQVEACRLELQSFVMETLTREGYLPPKPSPLIMKRILNAVAGQRWKYRGNPGFHRFLGAFEAEVNQGSETANKLLELASRNLNRSPRLLSKMLQLTRGIHESIDKATISIEMPEVAPAMHAQMKEIELFLAKDWTNETHRGVMAVHVDKLNQTTIMQIGIAEHGPVYVTIPEVLQPETAAMKSIEEVLRRLAPFTGSADPMAIIDGEFHRINYNEVFRKARVYRAPSGHTARLARNLQESARREKLAADNTVILNSAPKNEAEYLRIFPEDIKLRQWNTWGSEAQQWSETVVANQFAVSSDVSQQAMLTALTEAKNVIVLVAHCNGESIFMPEPPPNGSIVTSDYLLEHQTEIAANAPFVYLFSCEAGDMSNMRNFASTLLDCGASGVIASQTDIGSAQGRELLGRLLDERRGAPPLQDYFKAMQEMNYRDMEVFIA